MKRVNKSQPGVKIAPPVPTSVPTVEQSTEQIEAILSQHVAADQNTIVTRVLRLCIERRHEEAELARNAERLAMENFEKLFVTAKDVEIILKEIAERKAKGNV